MPDYTPQRAQRYKSKLRMAVVGPSGAGKTYSSLLFASSLGHRICVIDAERGSSQKYAERDGFPPFDIIVLDTFRPDDYIAAIEAAHGYDVLVIDGISLEWTATLELVDELTANSQSRNAYTQGWRMATPKHNQFVNAMLQYPGHLIVTIREKTKFILVDTPQGQVPKRAGWEMFQRDYLEYEWDIIVEMDFTNTMDVIKTRCPDIFGQKVRRPDATWMEVVNRWLGTGRRVYTLTELFDAVKSGGGGEAELKARMANLAPGVERYKDLRPSQIEALYLAFTVTEPIMDGTEGG